MGPETPVKTDGATLRAWLEVVHDLTELYHDRDGLADRNGVKVWGPMHLTSGNGQNVTALRLAGVKNRIGLYI